MKIFLVLGVILVLIGYIGLRLDLCQTQGLNKIPLTWKIIRCDVGFMVIGLLGMLSLIISAFLWAFD